MPQRPDQRPDERLSTWAAEAAADLPDMERMMEEWIDGSTFLAVEPDAREPRGR